MMGHQNTAEVEIRLFDADDLPEILELFRLTYGVDLDEGFYRWRFLENPYGPPMALLAVAQGRIVAHYAVCAASSRSPEGAIVNTVQSMTTMTHPDFRGRGLFPMLAERLYDEIRAFHDVELVFGFPNARSHYGFKEKLGWSDVHLMAFMSRQVGGRSPGGFRRMHWDELEPVVEVHGTSLSGWQPYHRDLEFLRWRYESCPTRNYWIVAPGDKGVPIALVVKEHTAGDGTRELDIVDFLGEHSRQSLLVAIDAALALAASRNLDRVNAWVDLYHPAWPALEYRRFEPLGPLTYFGGRGLAERWLGCFEPREWRITMGDSDVF